MDLKDKLLAFTATALGVAPSDVEAKLEDAEDASPILDLHKAKVKEQKEKNFNDGYKKAEKKVLSDREKEIKEEFGIESDSIGLDLIRELVETKAKSTDSEDTGEEPGKKKPLSLKDIPEELVKKHPLYLKKEQEAKEVEEKVTKKFQSEVEAVKAEYAAKETFKTVADRALAEFEKLNPILSADPEKARRQREIFINELKTNKYEFAGDEILVLTEEGNKKEDAHGNTYKFSELVKSAAEKYFDFKVAEDRSSTGFTSNTKAPGGKLFQGKMPTTQEEYNKIATDRSIPIEQRLEVQKEWQGKQTSNV